jgi:hypothetical protein
MLKAWNRAAGRPLHGFHLEVMAWKVLDPGWRAAWFGAGLGMGSDPENLARFFAEAPDRLRRKLPDPARGEGDIGAYLTDLGREEAISKLETAGSRCKRAAQLLADGDVAGANALYRKVFGDASPREGNQVAQRQRSPEAAELLAALSTAALIASDRARSGPGGCTGNGRLSWQPQRQAGHCSPSRSRLSTARPSANS